MLGGHHGNTSDNKVVILSHLPENVWTFSSTFAIHLAFALPIRFRFGDVYGLTALFLVSFSYGEAKRRVLKAIWC